MALYEAVHARPDGVSTVSRLAATASEYGYDGLVVRNRDGHAATFDPDRIRDAYGIDVIEGIEIAAADRSSAVDRLGRYRDERTVVCLRGGSLNRFGAEQPRLDVLADPMEDGDVNHVVSQAAARNGVRLEVNLGPILRRAGGHRVRAIQGLRKLGQLIRKYDVPYVVSGTAGSHLELRSPRELVAVGDLVGFDADAVEEGLREWGRIASRNRDRQSDAFVEPGVRRGRFEDDGEPDGA